MNMGSCAAKAKATCSASQELSATHACSVEAQHYYPSFTLKQTPEPYFQSSSSESEYPKSSKAAPLITVKVR